MFRWQCLSPTSNQHISRLPDFSVITNQSPSQASAYQCSRGCMSRSHLAQLILARFAFGYLAPPVCVTFVCASSFPTGQLVPGLLFCTPTLSCKGAAPTVGCRPIGPPSHPYHPVSANQTGVEPKYRCSDVRVPDDQLQLLLSPA